MTFPCIIVERPHQRPGRAWAARSEQEILDAAHAKEGDWLAEHVGDRTATVDDALEALGREGRDYRIAYMSAHTAGQRAAILADLAVAPLPKSFIGDDIVALGPQEGLPGLSNYNLAMIVAHDASAPVRAAAEHIRALRTHGSLFRGYYDELGVNSRLDELQATILRVKLLYTDRWNQLRRKLAQHYNDLFVNLDPRVRALTAAPGSTPRCTSSTGGRRTISG